MISEYLRPTSINEALELLRRPKPITFPLGGGTFLSTHQQNDQAVVDLQLLGLNYFENKDGQFHAGSMVTLQQIADNNDVSEAVREAVRHEASINLRRMASLGGNLVCGGGFSQLAVVLVAAQAKIVLLPEGMEESFSSWLERRPASVSGKLIQEIHWNSSTQLALEFVAKTPFAEPEMVMAAGVDQNGMLTMSMSATEFPRIIVTEKLAMIKQKLTSGTGLSSEGMTGFSDYHREIANVLAKRLLIAVDSKV